MQQDQPHQVCQRRPLDIDLLISRETLFTLFQPLVSVNGRQVMGVEALSRGQCPHTGRVVPPYELFTAADTDARLLALDRLCRKKALEAFAPLVARHAELLLSLNFEAALLDMGVGGSKHLYNTVRAAGVDPANVIIEIVESRVGDSQALAAFVEKHRQRGFLLALDDVGTGHSNLERLTLLKPDVVKIDRSLVAGLDQEFYRLEAARSLLTLAKSTGALVVAEGVERAAEAVMSLELGVDILQGYYFAKPAPPEDIRVGMCDQAIGRTAREFKNYTLAKHRLRQDRSRRFKAVVAQMLAELEGERGRDDLEVSLARLLDLHPSLECIYVLDAEGRQQSCTYCDPAKLSQQRKLIFRPAPKGTDQSLKHYYLLLAAGLEQYVSEPYISLASGSLCVTVSTWFTDGAGRRAILCADFDAGAVDAELAHLQGAMLAS